MSLSSPRRAPRRSGLWLIALVAVALLINVPLGMTMWTRYQIDQKGLTTEAVVEEDPDRTLGVPASRPRAWFVAYRLPRGLGDGKVFSTEVEKSVFDEATTTGRIEITYLPGEPHKHVVEGQVTHPLGFWLVGFADAALLAMLLLYLFVGRKQERELLLVALSDVERCPPAWTLTDLGDGQWLVTGEVAELFDDGLVIESRDGKRVRVKLGVFTNEIGYQQPARVRGLEVDRL